MQVVKALSLSMFEFMKSCVNWHGQSRRELFVFESKHEWKISNTFNVLFWVFFLPFLRLYTGVYQRHSGLQRKEVLDQV